MVTKPALDQITPFYILFLTQYKAQKLVRAGWGLLWIGWVGLPMAYMVLEENGIGNASNTAVTLG